ncbi:hypothetical protein CJ671_05685 [Aliarcobacter cryaerophilus]|uniref:Uncharacterized protein n=1 Tax=Aliarcobacter cryaerophilus TaxID=28198 RepID=A0A2S9STD4_9BACT|nr:hypothetical protein [Aliarcobacter cryaerophilus]PRM89847.1 hypothetical protein CJ671_05685 [Aliarcobacter cryaerophilus]
MNIFIYGNQNFKNEVNKILVSSKIELILEDVKIEDILNIDVLKEKIAANPNDIYLIDEDKIIKKSRFKFLKQKDGIQEEFLLQYGVNDLSIDSLEEIPNYIIRKYERNVSKEKDKSLELKDEDLVLDSELASLLQSKEQEDDKHLTSSILEEPVGINIKELDNLIEVDASDEVKTETNYINMEDFDENFGLNNVSFDYDDDSTFNEDLKNDEDLLQDILNASIVDENDYEFVGETFEDTNFLDEIFPNNTIFDMNETSIEPINIVLQEEDKKEDSLESIKDFGFDKVFEDIDVSKNEDINKIDKNIDIIDNLEEKAEEENLNEQRIEELDEFILENFDFEDLDLKNQEPADVSKKGEDMSDDFLELDSLNEQDLIEALRSSNISNTMQIDTQNREQHQQTESLNSNFDIDSSNINDIASLISKLLNNKTLEITIKIKE